MESIEKKTCWNKKCGKELPAGSKHKLCKECRRNVIGILIGGGLTVGAGVAGLAVGLPKGNNTSEVGDPVGLGLGDNSEVVNQTPKLPIEDYEWLLQNRGEEEANWAFDNVQRGQWSVDFVESNFMKSIKEYSGYIPVGCTACGGDYPNCKGSCPLNDD